MADQDQPTRGFQPRACWRDRIPPVALPPKKRSCNRHPDCEAADAEKRARGVPAEQVLNSHCYSEDCEDCFGK